MLSINIVKTHLLSLKEQFNAPHRTITMLSDKNVCYTFTITVFVVVIIAVNHENDVGILLNIASDHLGEHDIHTLDELARNDGFGVFTPAKSFPIDYNTQDLAWFDFDALCEGPRATADYIEVAREHHTVLVGGIPVFDAGRDDPARRFVHLVRDGRDAALSLVRQRGGANDLLSALEPWRESGGWGRTMAS